MTLFCYCAIEKFTRWLQVFHLRVSAPSERDRINPGQLSSQLETHPLQGTVVPKYELNPIQCVHWMDNSSLITVRRFADLTVL